MSRYLPPLLFVVASLFVRCTANAFLQAREADKYIAKQDVERALLSELSGLSSSAHVQSVKDKLRPMFAALPRNQQGKLEPAVVRYALHRFFVQQHGWYMLGLDPARSSVDSKAPAAILKDKAPALIQSLFEQRLKGKGLGLDELAVFAVVLSDLVEKESTGGLHKVFTSLRLPTVGSVPHLWSVQAVKTYMMLYLVGGNITVTDASQIDILQRELLEIYPDWPGTYMWVEDLRETHTLRTKPQCNPFVKRRDSFDNAVELVRELSHSFGAFQDLECKTLKSRLVALEHRGTGRVHLSSFYAGGISGDWTLSESVGYLRNLGVLDETDPLRPSVVIPNYMTSQTNCLSASGFYSTCCTDECEALRYRLEISIASPSSTPGRVAQLISNMHSDTVDAPRNVSTALLVRLDEIAALHGGHVPLHGRLFAQWMHHAYPRECPYPHLTGTTNPMSPEDWMAHAGVDNVEATIEEMQLHHARIDQDAADAEEKLPWSHVEELVASQDVPSSTWSSVPVRLLMVALALASFALPLLRVSKIAVCGSSATKLESLLV